MTHGDSDGRASSRYDLHRSRVEYGGLEHAGHAVGRAARLDPPKASVDQAVFQVGADCRGAGDVPRPVIEYIRPKEVGLKALGQSGVGDRLDDPVINDATAPLIRGCDGYRVGRPARGNSTMV